MITKLKSIKSIIAGLYRDLGNNTELNESDIIEWVAEALNLIGSYSQLEEVSVVLTLENHRVLLPCDFVYPKDIMHEGRPLSWASKSASNNYNCPECENIPKCCTENNFYIQDGYLNSSIKEGDLCIVYLATPVDEDGFPLVPDNVYFDKALKAYITFMFDKIQFRRGLITESVFKYSEREWLFYVNSARGSSYMPDSSQMERLKQVWVRLIPKQNSYLNNFRDIATRERRSLK